MAPSTTDDDIVAAIVHALKPWKSQHRQIETGKKAGWLEEKPKAEVLAMISDAVREDILRLRETVPNFFHRKAIQKTREDAREMLRSIDQIEQQLSAKTLSPELRLRLSHVPHLSDTLKATREICEAGDKNQPNGDEVKRWCARVAMSLVVKFSEESPSAGSARSKYCEITDLLYWAVTAKKQSLRHICQDLLSGYRQAGLRP